MLRVEALKRNRYCVYAYGSKPNDARIPATATGEKTFRKSGGVIRDWIRFFNNESRSIGHLQGSHMKKLACCFLLAVIIQTAHSAEESLPPGTIRRGTMANAQLISDTKAGVASKVGALGCTDLGNVETYVTVLPHGQPNSRHWSELWIVAGCGKTYPVAIDFSSDGKDADWIIR